MAPILYPDERVDYVARTLGISPSHDHCIVTTRRVWVSYTSLTPTPAVHYARDFITDATPLKKSRIVLHTADGAQHDIRLDFAEDRPALLESPTRVRCRKGHAAGCLSFVPPA
ncbi:hypothetical protein [Gordonia otitidis]|uniref:Uncharacterized protein n=1 Tax=Gordonia otitidis (strain DSM 44809 / CCUG 52243 / JCM 12355 / NBRC 100426 / IFM 10032) TaxID=1108044 RepID=H5TIA1_GORO1|nr:hypothetical protein [Gordonia otitidis]GAB33209.1 hypothetical protein GOOTI_050_00130 [Gordonia otitidis NBRC 100426]